jgi:hypothetical protein
VTKKIRLFDQEVGFYTLEIQNEKLEGFPHLLNEAYVLGLSILQEENDDTWALGLDQLDGAVSPWFEDLQQLEEYCRQAGPGKQCGIRNHASLPESELFSLKESRWSRILALSLSSTSLSRRHMETADPPGCSTVPSLVTVLV